MRISDWSSDVCSSDLGDVREFAAAGRGLRPHLPSRLPLLGAQGYAGGQDAAAPRGAAQGACRPPAGGRRADRKSVVSGKGVSVRVDLGGRRIIKQKNKVQTRNQTTTLNNTNKL